MKNSVEMLYDATLELVSKIEDVQPEQLIELTEFRARVIEELQENQHLISDCKAMLTELSNYDELIVERMERFKRDAQQSISKIRTSRMQKGRYEHAYTAGSYFIDKKK